MSTRSNRPLRAYRKASGLCYRCGLPSGAGQRTCADCLAWQRDVAAKRRAVGLCYCGRQAMPGRKRCKNCLASLRDASKRKRSVNAGRGLCVCGRERRPGRTACAVCAGRGLARELKRRNAGLCRCGKHPAVRGMATCQPCRDYKAGRLREIREQVICGYGGHCSCCGEDDPNVIELDHVNNDGTPHRKQVGGPGTRMYEWAIRNRFPPTLQILCANCHLAKTRTGDCSYRRRRSTSKAVS